jgi:hypothetical protein
MELPKVAVSAALCGTFPLAQFAVVEAFQLPEPVAIQTPLIEPEDGTVTVKNIPGVELKLNAPGRGPEKVLPPAPRLFDEPSVVPEFVRGKPGRKTGQELIREIGIGVVAVDVGQNFDGAVRAAERGQGNGNFNAGGDGVRNSGISYCGRRGAIHPSGV